jgi:FkbM family methyltransferase
VQLLAHGFILAPESLTTSLGDALLLVGRRATTSADYACGMTEEIDQRHQRQHAIGKSDAPPHPVTQRFPVWNGWVDPGWDINFLGVRTRVAFFSLYEQLADFSQRRQVSAGRPIPNEDYFEWITLLEAVVEAERSFTMVELGAGWGRWIVNGIGALRAHGELPYHVVGVESEPTHFKWMQQHLRDNAVDLRSATLVEAAVASNDGHVWFHMGAPADWYGQAISAEPQEGQQPALRERVAHAVRRRVRRAPGRTVERVRAVSLATLLEPLDLVDLIDADIQGAEADALEPAADLLDAKVKRVYVATHTRDNEDRVRSLFNALGWDSVWDYPCGAESDTPWGRILFEDGAQVWRNPKA